MRKVLIIIFLSMSLISGISVEALYGQQLPQFSQYMFNSLHVNPAYAGYKQEGYIQSTYRAQWINFPGAPRTFTLTGDFSANEGRMGFGASVLADNLGPASTRSVLLTYAYRIRTSEYGRLSLGLSAGGSQYEIDHDKLDPRDWPDSQIPQGRANLITPNLNAGVLYYTDRFFAGVSAYNMIGKRALKQEDIALAYHDFHYYLTAGALFPLSYVVDFKPSILVKHIQNSPSNYDLNAMFLFYGRLWFGASYRSNTHLWAENLHSGLSKKNALAFILEIFATDDLRIGYAYDYNLNALHNLRNSSHEISVGYYISPRRVTWRNQRWF